MAIYRGPGGPGDATPDAGNSAQVAQGFANDAANSAAAAANSAANAGVSAAAALAAKNSAELAETNAETAEANALAAQVAAEAARDAAQLAQTNAEAAQLAAELAETGAGNAQLTAEAAQLAAEAAQLAAENAQTAAEAAEANAALSESNALASEQAAALSESNALASEQAAALSESNALASEQAAALSESNAAYSESNAALSEANALASEQAAALSESNALASEQAAALSESNALASEQAAALSESNAAYSESNAALSESNAALSESNAALSESNALASESKAQQWATEAEDVPVETSPDLFSAFHWAQKAQDFASGNANNISYDNTTSGLTATNVQAAIDELESTGVTLTDTQTLTNKTISGSDNTISNVSLASQVTGTLPVANGGTGAATLTANNVLLGNGTSALQAVAPSTTGNVLTSNGTTWTSAAVPATPIASTAEAEAGTNNTNFITPLRMREGFNAGGSAPIYACRAWVNFDGLTGSGNTIRASGNVSSVTRNSTGVYTVNLSTAMPDANYSAISNQGNSDSVNSGIIGSGNLTTTSYQIRTRNGSNNDTNFTLVSSAIFR